MMKFVFFYYSQVLMMKFIVYNFIELLQLFRMFIECNFPFSWLFMDEGCTFEIVLALLSCFSWILYVLYFNMLTVSGFICSAFFE